MHPVKQHGVLVSQWVSRRCYHNCYVNVVHNANFFALRKYSSVLFTVIQYFGCIFHTKTVFVRCIV